jgi:hypothetical protein
MKHPPFNFSALFLDDDFPAQCALEDLDAQKYEPAPPTDKPRKATKRTDDSHRRHFESPGLIAVLCPKSAECTTELLSKLSKSLTVTGMISTSRE